MLTSDVEFSLGFMTFIPPGANPTPIQIADLTDVTVKPTQELAPFRSDSVFAKGYGLMEADFAITAKSMAFRADAVAYIFGGTSAAGDAPELEENGTIPGTPYQITVTQSANFLLDLGVYDKTLKKYLDRVASAPATGQYSVSAGVYTFAAADTTHGVRIRYKYTAAGVGLTTTISNRLSQILTPGALYLYNNYGTGRRGYKFPAAYLNPPAATGKARDWTEFDIEIKVAEDDSGVVAVSYRYP